MNCFALYIREFSAMRSRVCTATHGRKLAYARELSAMLGRGCTATHGRKLACAFVESHCVHFVLTLAIAKLTKPTHSYITYVRTVQEVDGRATIQTLGTSAQVQVAKRLINASRMRCYCRVKTCFLHS